MLGDHLSEDIVGGAVEDSIDLGDIIGGETASDRMNYRDSAADAGFKQIPHVIVRGDLKQLGAEIGDDLLIRGNDALARLQRPLGKFKRGM